MKKLLILFLVLAGISAFSQTREQFKEEQELRASISRFNAELSKVRREIFNSQPVDQTELIATRDSLQEKVHMGFISYEQEKAYLRRIESINAQIARHGDDPLVYKSLLLKEKYLLDTIRDMNGMLNMFQRKSIGEAMNDKIPVAINSCRAKKYKNSHSVRKSEAQADIAELQVKKLSEQPVIADSIKGYYGKLYNRTERTDVEFVIKDPNDIMYPKSHVIGPKQTKIEYLLPGRYIVEAYVSDQRIWVGEIYVSAQINEYLGDQVHFYIAQKEDIYIPRRYLSVR